MMRRSPIRCSQEHLDDRDASCPMIGLPSDAARAGEAVKPAYREVLERMARAFETNLPQVSQRHGSRP